VRFKKQPPPPPLIPPPPTSTTTTTIHKEKPFTVRSLVQKAIQHRLEPSLPSQRFDPSSPFQLKGRAIVKKNYRTPAPPPPHRQRRQQSNLKTPAPPPPKLGVKTPAPPPPKRQQVKTPAPPPPKEEKKQEQNLLREQNNQLRSELERRRQELEQSNRKLLEHTQESSKLLQGLRDRLEEARLDIAREAEQETSELREQIATLRASHEEEMREQEEKLKLLREQLKLSVEASTNFQSDMVKLKNVQKGELETRDNELNSLREELRAVRVNFQETSSIELKSLREELGSSLELNKRLCSEIERLKRSHKERDESERYKARMLLVSHGAARVARRRCLRRSTATQKPEVNIPQWWCKIQEQARQDSCQYLQENNNQEDRSTSPHPIAALRSTVRAVLQRQEEYAAEESRETTRPISALRTAVRSVLQRRTQCRDAVLNLFNEDADHAQTLRKRTSQLDSRLKAVMKKLKSTTTSNIKSKNLKSFDSKAPLKSSPSLLSRIR